MPFTRRMSRDADRPPGGTSPPIVGAKTANAKGSVAAMGRWELGSPGLSSSRALRYAASQCPCDKSKLTCWWSADSHSPAPMSGPTGPALGRGARGQANCPVVFSGRVGE